MAQDVGTLVGMMLRRAREQAGLTQAELARRLGCTQPAVAQAEASGDTLTIGTIRRFAEALGCDLKMMLIWRKTG